MKHFSADIVHQVQEFNTQIKTGHLGISKEAALDKQSQLTFLASELPEDEKDELKKICAENEELAHKLD